MRVSRRLFVRVGCALAAIATCTGVLAQAYPNKPVRWIIGYAPGGGSDRAVRVLATRLAERLGQPVVVDNRPGAAGIIASELVARSAPDGYTLLSVDNGAMVFNPLLRKDLPYDPTRDFAPVALYGKFPLVLAVNAQKVPVDSVRALIERSKSEPIDYASPGPGSPQHLVAELFKERTGAALGHVAYRGTAPLTQDLLGGQVGVSFLGVITALPLLQAGKLRALAVAEPTRLHNLPNVPTMAEAGVPNVVGFAWQGVVVPAKTPASIVKRLHAELDATLKQPDIQERLQSLGVEPLMGDPEQMGTLVRDDLKLWGDVIRTRGITLEN